MTSSTAVQHKHNAAKAVLLYPQHRERRVHRERQQRQAYTTRHRIIPDSSQRRARTPPPVVLTVTVTLVHFIPLWGAFLSIAAIVLERKFVLRIYHSCMIFDLQRHMDDKRFERELKHKEVLQKQADEGASKESEQAPSATYDAFMRMQTGQETRTIADKINDPNRVSWEQFRKDNADKLDIPGADRRKMVEYRAQLDKERDSALAKGRNRPKRKLGVSSSESEGEGEGEKDGSGSEDGGGSSSRRKKHRKKEKKSKKSSKHKSRRKGSGSSKKSSKKSSKRRKDDGGDSDSSDSDTDGESDESKRRRRRKDKKSKKKDDKEPEAKGADPRRLSAFLQGSSGSGSD
ncbi:unnamed protein product [Pylaiella littoralis]